MAGQGARQKGVRRKLSAIDSEFAGRCVLLVDDSIVRGTTSKEIVTMAREAGARKVIFASCAPPITHPHIYGIDLASPNELIASDRGPAEISRIIDADEVIYQDLDDLKAACAELSPPEGPKEFEVGVFSGRYITEVPKGYFQHLMEVRGKKRKFVEAPRSGTLASSGPVIVPNDTTIKVSGALQAPVNSDALPRSPEKRRSMARSPLRDDIR